jgi:peptidoglycan-associated lipoprotein
MANMKMFRLLVAMIAVVGMVSLGACTTGKDTKDASETGDMAGGNNPDGTAPGSMQETHMLENVYFAFDSSELIPETRNTLNGHADWLKANTTVQVQIEGHCDERGTEEYNLSLGERRANAVKDYLAGLGVDSARLYTISYGEEIPVDPGHTEDAWVKNRRAHFLITAQ